MTNKILVLLSGGTDSATCLAQAVKEVGAENVETLNMTYGQRHDKEIYKAMAIARHYGVTYNLIDLTNVPASTIAKLAHTPASAIGSCRRKLTDADYPTVIETLKKFDIGCFF